MLCSIEFGNTSSVIGVFQVMAGLTRLWNWSVEVLWPWYKTYLPDCAQMRELVLVKKRRQHANYKDKSSTGILHTNLRFGHGTKLCTGK